jgi:hypothetical protein
VPIAVHKVGGYVACLHCDNTSLGVDGPCQRCGMPPHQPTPRGRSWRRGDRARLLTGQVVQLIEPSPVTDEGHNDAAGLLPFWYVEGIDKPLSLGGAVLLAGLPRG